MADVFLAAAHGPAGFNKLVVVKKLRDARSDDASFVSMFLDEARLAARLNHPNVVHTYEIGEHGDGYFIAMEYLEGQPLHRIAQAMRRRGTPLSPPMAAHLIAEALHGLHYAHEMKDYDGTRLAIVHRDVSPQNLHVAYDGQMRVLDFGIAKAALNTSQTQAGVLKGKFAYMSPEQATGEEVDRRSDVFAAGIVLWEILTGERLFKGDNAVALGKLLQAQVERPSSRNPLIPHALDEIVLCALRRNPSERFANAQDMANALEDYIHATGTRVRREDVARCLDDLFGELRAEAHRQIQNAMAALPPASPSSMDLTAFAQTGGNPSFAPLSGVVHRSSGMLPQDIHSSIHTNIPTAAPRLPSAPPPSPRSRGMLYALGAIALVGGSAFAFGVLSRGPTPPGSVSPAALDGAGSQNGKGALNRPANMPVVPEGESFHLTLSSDPLEAQVEWAGKPVGQTPMLIDLLAGPQTFVLTREGYFNATVVVNVTEAMAGQTQSRTVVLVPRSKGAPGSATQPVVYRERTSAKVAPAEKPERESDRAPVASAHAEAARAPEAASVLAAAAVPSPVVPSATAPANAAAIVDAPHVAAAAPTATVPTVLPFGPEMTRPALLSGDDPVYSREAIIAKVEGVMIAKCTITVAGTLQNCRIVKGLPYMDKSMLDSLATRRYSPVMSQGKPVAVEYVFNVKLVRPR